MTQNHQIVKLVKLVLFQLQKPVLFQNLAENAVYIFEIKIKIKSVLVVSKDLSLNEVIDRVKSADLEQEYVDYLTRYSEQSQNKVNLFNIKYYFRK